MLPIAAVWPCPNSQSFSTPVPSQSDSDRTRGLGATDDMQGWAFVKESLMNKVVFWPGLLNAGRGMEAK